jgi:hypothetical protein
MAKFQVSCTITSEQVFALLAKLIPLDDLHLQVRELAPERPQEPQLENYNKPTSLPAPRYPTFGRKGMVNIVLSLLTHRPHNLIELRKAIVADGYSRKSVDSLIYGLEKKKRIIRVGDGTWTIWKKP